MASPWFRRLGAGSHSGTLGSRPVQSMWNKVALGQIFLQLFRFSTVNIIPPGLHTHISSEGWARWWPQFRDIVSFHRYKQKQQQLGVRSGLLDRTA
jgi:hypothetical protein